MDNISKLEDYIVKGTGLLNQIRYADPQPTSYYKKFDLEWFEDQVRNMCQPEYLQNKHLLSQYEIQLEMLQEDLLAEDFHKNKKYKTRLEIKGLKKLIKELKKKL